MGLFENRFISDDVDPHEITASHIPLTLEAAQKSIVLLENRNSTLPLYPTKQGIQKIALIGPFGDTFNYGGYSGQWGGSPVANASTIRQGISQYLASHSPETELVTSWGANSWTYNGQYNIPPYLLSAKGTTGGLLATYFADTELKEARIQRLETPSLNWGLYPPAGLPSNNFSAVWEGDLNVPVDGDVNGWLGVAVHPNTTARLYVDGELLIHAQATTTGSILSNIPGLSYSNSTDSKTPPPGSSPFTFRKGAIHSIRLEYRAWNYAHDNISPINAQILLFWNLVDRNNPVGKVSRLQNTNNYYCC